MAGVWFCLVSTVLRRLDTIHHSALRICSGAFRTSPVESLYVICHQLPLHLRRQKISALYFFRAQSVPKHPISQLKFPAFLHRLYAARPSHILPFCERTKMLLHDSDLNNVSVQLSDFFTFPPWEIPQFSFLNPFSGFDKSSTAPVTFQQLFHHHRYQYSSFLPIFTDGSKSDGHVGCGVVSPSDTLSYRLHNSCSVFTAELVAIFCALQEISPSSQRNFIIYTDSMSALETLSHYDTQMHPVGLEILSILQFLRNKSFNIIFCWVPSHVGISGNETADAIAKFASAVLPRALPYVDIKKFFVSRLFSLWQQKWDLLTNNKLHSVKPSIGLWPILPIRQVDVKLSRLRIGHTRFTHKYLIFGERAPVCPTCHQNFTVHHILIECPSFKSHRVDHFHLSSVTLQDLVGDLNGHSSFWGSSDSNSRGLQIEQFIADHNLCLLNSDEKTHFHLPTRTFHSVDLAICSPPLLPFLSLTIDNDLYNSDHFPLILTDSRHNQTSHFRPPKYIFNAANWHKFTSLANINSDIIKSSTIDQAIDYVVNVIIEAADNSIPKTSGMRRKQNKPWWNAHCQQARKKQKKAWGVFRRHPSTANFINFKKTKAEFRKIQRRNQRESWRKFVSSINSKISSRQLWNKVKKASGVCRSNSISVLIYKGNTISNLKDIANSTASTLADTSSNQIYPPSILNNKKKAEKQKLNFISRTNQPYNCDFTFMEFQSSLSNVHDSSPGPDKISYSMIKHLSIASQNSILDLYNRIWREHYFPTLWQQAIIIPLLKPGKDPTNPSNYRPIALTSCLCKLFERMINKRLIYYMEGLQIICTVPEWDFRTGRSTNDNLFALETDIRLGIFYRGSILTADSCLDIEKAYDTTWRYGILKDLHDLKLKRHLPIFFFK
ncbi:hypothetical protein AVEN_243503-1 [Araneus ventricosus]|uniref:RNase H type-1 domain-containing protein n=1 Tax=Araneus ventricosus TaxID=182803 RepID=A0A4Y2Q3C3_ARAVE|nr:hypothetical protein AVEN_243503-1 [Araneus ventricosus]